MLSVPPEEFRDPLILSGPELNNYGGQDRKVKRENMKEKRKLKIERTKGQEREIKRG
jgi:hypothetical protein